MKLLLDMNIPLGYAELLAQKGVEAVRWSDVGSPTAADTEIMAYAHNNGYAVLTYDLDFSAILSVTHQLKPSIVQIRASALRSGQATDLIAAAIIMNEAELDKGAVMSIDLNKARVRLLPI